MYGQIERPFVATRRIYRVGEVVIHPFNPPQFEMKLRTQAFAQGVTVEVECKALESVQLSDSIITDEVALDGEFRELFPLKDLRENNNSLTKGYLIDVKA
jgi:hypothetical protein